MCHTCHSRCAQRTHVVLQARALACLTAAAPEEFSHPPSQRLSTRGQCITVNQQFLSESKQQQSIKEAPLMTPAVTPARAPPQLPRFDLTRMNVSKLQHFPALTTSSALSPSAASARARARADGGPHRLTLLNAAPDSLVAPGSCFHTQSPTNNGKHLA